LTAQPESTSGTLPGLAPPARRRRLGRALAWLGFAVLAVVLAAIVKLLAPVWHDPTARFIERKGELVSVERESETHLDSSTIIERRLRSDTGLTVELSVRVPDGRADPKPTLLLLGGHETGRDAVRLVAADEVIVAAISYPGQGLTGLRGIRAVMNVARYQRGVLDTVPSVLLAADYLVSQPYVATDKLELVGVSLGAFFVAPAGALDTRFRRVWIVHGSGDPHAVIEYALRREIASAGVRRAGPRRSTRSRAATGSPPNAGSIRSRLAPSS
jgi:hypothetical protein